MKISTIKITAILFIGLILFNSCKRYTDEFYGPGLGVAPDDFTTSSLTVSDNTADFSAGPINFSCSMSATVRWTLTLTGGTSGAVKVLRGLSKEIDASNGQWDGSTDTTRLFRKNETVTAVLTVLGWERSATTTLTISTEKNHGYVIATFDNITVNQLSANWQDPNPPAGSGYWWFFSFEANEKDLVDKIADPGTPQGTHALQMVGHDANTSYYIGQSGLSAPAGVFNFGTVTLNDFYFNVYVKGSGTEASKDYKLVIQVFEDDNSSGTIQYDGSEDKYIYPISLQYDGWKLFRIKYSDFVIDAAAASSPYKTHTPERIANIGFFFGANTSAGLSSTAEIDVRMDYFTITTNGPMIP
jgi:hypothetical protein